MAVQRMRFRNAQTGYQYDFELNPSEEAEVVRSRNIGHGAPTGLIGLVRQQGEDNPLRFTYRGRILKEAMKRELINWYESSRTKTVYVRDYAGDEFVALITEFTPKRVRVAWNQADPENAPYWVYDYTLTIEVISVLSGSWYGIAP